MSDSRKFKVPLAELIDKLTVDQIKYFLKKEKTKDKKFLEEIDNICYDIDQIISEKKIPLSSKTIRMIIVLSQINLHIWNLKDNMVDDEENYDQKLKLAHQLNGIRNQIKNAFLEISKGWNINFLRK